MRTLVVKGIIALALTFGSLTLFHESMREPNLTAISYSDFREEVQRLNILFDEMLDKFHQKEELSCLDLSSGAAHETCKSIKGEESPHEQN